MTNIVYQAHGDKQISKELIYSLYTLLANYKGELSHIRFIIYTDDILFFQTYLPNSIIYVKINQAQIDTWAGALSFVHRIKIEMILDVFSRFDGAVLYLDTDTIIDKDLSILLAEISSIKSIMHLCEGQINQPHNPIMKKMNNFLKANFKELQITNVLQMWNAGVLGIAKENKALVEKVLQVTDRIFAMYPKHVMEQFAFSYILTQSTSVIAAEAYISHYWKYKKEYRIAIENTLSPIQSSPDMVAKLQSGKINLQLSLPRFKSKSELRFLKWKNSLKKLFYKSLE